MYLPHEDVTVTSGFMIVRKPRALYEEFRIKLDHSQDTYGWPRKDRPWSEGQTAYRGTDRDPLSGWKDAETLAEIRFDELEKQGKAIEQLILTEVDVTSVLAYIAMDGTHHDREVIWVREIGANDSPPRDYVLLGYEPTWFPGPFSALCDSMFLPRWHAADPEGVVLAEHYRRTNHNGLFSNESDARAFLGHYLSFDWAEQPMSDTPGESGSYTVLEVYASNSSAT